ncbi:MAG: hybrid sensor histidine kinase/response regulator, partial [Planctomycetota bacterium]
MPQALTVLLIDDDPSLRRITGAHIEKHGFDLHLAADGEEGYRLACELKPELIVSDIMMPRVNGLDLVRMVRENPQIESSYIILLTAKDHASDVLEGFSAKADDYITKPFAIGELIARINAGARIKNLQRDLAEKNRLLEESIALQARFFGMATHDLRAPLSIVTTYASLLGQDIISDEEIQQVCVRRAQGMMHLIDDVLNLTRFEAGTIKLNCEDTNLLSIIDCAVELYRPVAQEKGISLRFDHEVPPIQCICDAKRIAEIFENLISNAIKYTETGGEICVE